MAALLDSCRPDVPRAAWHQAGTDFHVELARLSGNPFLLKALRGVMTRLSRARWLEVLTETSRAQAWSEHRRILELIRERQPDAAAEAAAAHIRATRDRLLRSLDGEAGATRGRGLGGRGHISKPKPNASLRPILLYAHRVLGDT